MNLLLNTTMAKNYKSLSQKARVITEDWVSQNMFCPKCGHEHINSLPNNSPVADFSCPLCKQEYELKSKSGKISSKITDGAYSTMIERITSNLNPHLFVMEYVKASFTVKNFAFIPNYLFVPSIIEKRNPLAETARRAGWIGCNILLHKIPYQGIVHIVSNGMLHDKNDILLKTSKTQQLKTKEINSRGWLLDTLLCVNAIPAMDFSLKDIYKHERKLSDKHPENNNIQAKIRQQLQLLRDKGYIEFLGNGNYKKLT